MTLDLLNPFNKVSSPTFRIAFVENSVNVFVMRGLSQ